jgi:hypothetical protein
MYGFQVGSKYHVVHFEQDQELPIHISYVWLAVGLPGITGWSRASTLSPIGS